MRNSSNARRIQEEMDHYISFTWCELLENWKLAMQDGVRLNNHKYDTKFFVNKVIEEAKEWGEEQEVEELADLIGVISQILCLHSSSISMLSHAALYKYVSRLVEMENGNTWDNAKAIVRGKGESIWMASCSIGEQDGDVDSFSNYLSEWTFNDIKVLKFSGSIPPEGTARLIGLDIKRRSPDFLVMDSLGGSVAGGGILCEYIRCPILVQRAASAAAVISVAKGCFFFEDSVLAFHPVVFNTDGPMRLNADTLSDMLMGCDIWFDFHHLFSSSERQVVDELMKKGRVLSHQRDIPLLLTSRIVAKSGTLNEFLKGVAHVDEN